MLARHGFGDTRKKLGLRLFASPIFLRSFVFFGSTDLSGMKIGS